MRRLETLDFWPDLLAQKDELSLRELSETFGVTPGAISAALKRTGTTRDPAPPGPRSARRGRHPSDALPPEPGESPNGAPKPRPGSKDHLLTEHFHLLGNVPDAEVAREAAVSVRTVASYRARHKIGGYSGPRRTSSGPRQRPSKIDSFAHLLGKVADRVVAQEASVSLNAVRNYRNKRGIPAAPRERSGVLSGTSTGTGPCAWQVTLRIAGEEKDYAVIADSMADAIERANEAHGQVVGLRLVGPVL
ncbi:MAG: hypothetical protein AB8H79_25250 [Myxococcota bacterium]